MVLLEDVKSEEKNDRMVFTDLTETPLRRETPVPFGDSGMAEGVTRNGRSDDGFPSEDCEVYLDSSGDEPSDRGSRCVDETATDVGNKVATDLRPLTALAVVVLTTPIVDGVLAAGEYIEGFLLRL